MRLYLVQHAEAKREEEDPSRPLTDRGRREAIKVASYAARIGVRIEKIIHSGKLRALQTAEIMAEHLNPPGGIGKAEGLDPQADPKVFSERLKALNEDIMVVGHLPHLSRLASLLLTGDPSIEPVRFRQAGIVCLERDDRGKWSLIWALRPEEIP
ncbi:phosphohistidine phosphatase SixA [Candidatus Bathyarchaeota archaeon]|nr:phosphohistidine phosphatase SixA [Candidatus Bathyarchaeota archaeon]